MQGKPRPARTVLGPYELGERLGLGGMAEVFVAYRAGPHGFAKKVALKRILPELAQDSRFVAMFCDEARISAPLCHPNIVQVIDFGESQGELFMAMEYVEGVSLAKLLRYVSGRRERFPLGAALFIAHEVLTGLSFAHDACDENNNPLHIVHRDVSPGNVLIGRAGDVKLADFGIVRSAYVDRRTYPGELKGKVGYMSPEQVMGIEVDPRSDLFTVGIILSEMLIARPLFSGQNEFDILTKIYEADLSALDKYGTDLAPPVLDVLRQALAKAPADRFDSARSFAAALRRLAQSSQITLDDSELVPWLSALGVLPSRSGTHEVTRLPSTLGPTAPPPAPSPRPVLRPTTAAPPPLSRNSVPAAPMPGLPFRRALVRPELPALVFAISLNADTGELHVEGTHGELRLAFEDGKLVAPHGSGAEMLLRGLFAFGDGMLTFTASRSEHPVHMQRISILPVVSRIVRERFTVNEIAAWLAPIRRLPLNRGTSLRRDPSEFGLSLGERRAIEQAPHKRSLDELGGALASAGMAEPAEVMRGVFLGLSLGLLNAPGWAWTQGS
ncbi:MAG: serine/threonine protein kinase [Myxococcales bacterium]|nr:MAG: serine/threonine protein kinase [Myxococcales bacterium]